MKKIILTTVLSVLLMTGISSAGIVTINFDGVLDLQDSVFGFQADYNLSSGQLLEDSNLKIYYTKRFNGSAIVDEIGKAVPGTDMSLLGMDPNTEWDISIANNEATGGSNAIVGYTLGSDPLLTGTLLTITIPESVTLNLTNWVLSDALGSATAFSEGDNFIVKFDAAIDTYTISAVPVPSSLLLLFGGICALLGINRRKK